MAKVASSKPYGSGKRNSAQTESDHPPKDQIPGSPIRTSPRRKKSTVNEEATEIIADNSKDNKKGKTTLIPEPPRFTDTKKLSQKQAKTPQKKATKSAKSPKTPKSGGGRRKSAREPIILSEAEEREEREEREEETSGELEQDQEQDLIDYVESIHQENRAMFEEQVEDEEYIDYEGGTEATDDTEDFHYDEDELTGEYDESEESNESEYNDQFKYTSESIRSRLSQYFNRQESTITNTPTTSSSAFTSLTTSTGRSQLWNNMKDWISDRVIPSAREIGEVTVDYTRRAIGQISKRLESTDKTETASEIDDFDGDEYVQEEEISVSMSEDSNPKIYEITDDFRDEGQDEPLEQFEHKRSKMEDYEMQPDSNVDSHNVDSFNLESKGSSYHSFMSQHDVTLVMEPTVNEELSTPGRSTEAQVHQQQWQSTSSMIQSDILNSRLTEIVLFLAKCSKDTSLPSIYEHLEELFTLKGENSLNFTEKQLVSTVIGDYLTEKPVSVAESELTEMMMMGNTGKSNTGYEPIMMTGSSPKRVKVLPSSGIRFRAPKFTPEEEALLEELEQARLQQQQKTSSKLTTALATPSQRSKLQKKLLNPEMTAEMIHSLPDNRGRIGVGEKRKADSVSDAIEDIIAQKV